MDSVVIFQYSLKKYARWKIASNEKSALQEVEGTDQGLKLILYNSHHLIISNNRTVEENVCLLNCKDTVQALVHEDNMQIHIKLQTYLHKFRLKFSPDGGRTGAENCLKCSDALASYIPVRGINKKSKTPENADKNKSPTAAYQPIPCLDGNIAVSQMAQVIDGRTEAHLPLAYQQEVQSDIDDKELARFIGLCLCDSSFPAFVTRVNDALKKFE